MIKSYKLKIYGNNAKIKNLGVLLDFWRKEVQDKIDIFWCFDSINGNFPPREFCSSGRIGVDLTAKAWHIVKLAKKLKQEKPMYRGNELDMNSSMHLEKINSKSGCEDAPRSFSII